MHYKYIKTSSGQINLLCKSVEIVLPKLRKDIFKDKHDFRNNNVQIFGMTSVWKGLLKELVGRKLPLQTNNWNIVSEHSVTTTVRVWKKRIPLWANSRGHALKET